MSVRVTQDNSILLILERNNIWLMWEYKTDIIQRTPAKKISEKQEEE
jgi:hypothetical protein